jgi:hypothetical protein
LQGQWKGDLNPGSVNVRNWADVLVGFTDNPVPTTVAEFGVMVFRKRYDPVSTSLVNLTPAQNGQWDWEDIDESLVSGQSLLNEATAQYMVVSFHVGGQIYAALGSYVIDNISVIGCSEFPAADLTGDCIVDFADTAVLVSKWLQCNVDPATSCWQ